MRYTTIIYDVKKTLCLSLREYIYLDTTYHLQAKNGWSYATNDYYSEILEVLPREIQRISKTLEEKGLIVKSPKGVKTTDAWNDVYLGVSEKTPQPCLKRHPNHVLNDVDTIDKDNDKEIDNKGGAKTPPRYNPLGAEVIKAMETIDPKNKRYYGNTTQREACDFLITEYSLEGVLGAVNFYTMAYGKVKYLPSISTPCELRDKWHKLQGLLARKGAENSEQVNNAVW